MKDKVYMFDLMDTLVWSPNLMKLFATENAELLAKFKQDPKTWQRETARVADVYLADGRVEIIPYEESAQVLGRLRNSGRIAVLSNGVPNTIDKIIKQASLDLLVDERLSLEQFNGRDKSEAALYTDVAEYLGSRGLSTANYTDDKDKYCRAASMSGVIPQVFQIVRAGEAKPSEGYKIIKSLEEI